MMLKRALLFCFLVFGPIVNSEESDGGCGCSGGKKLDRESYGSYFEKSSSSAEEVQEATSSADRKNEAAQEQQEAIRRLSTSNTYNISQADSPLKDMVFIKGGTFYMGVDSPLIVTDGEGPRRLVTVSDFFMDKYEASNDEYRKFVEATKYRTESEVYGWSFVFDMAIPDKIKQKITQAVLSAEWWLPVNGSYWREPEGPGTDVFKTKRERYPAVHISWNDAVKFCEWRGARLPTEAEWEYAAKGGKSSNNMFPWGNKLMSGGKHRANIWQGDFPITNTAEDGYKFLCPVDAFPPQNEYGLYNMIGNAWEWVQDWFTITHTTEHLVNPKGPDIGRDRVKKGGSFLCHRSACYRYRVAARYPTTPDSATLNGGFRCAMDAPAGAAAVFAQQRQQQHAHHEERSDKEDEEEYENDEL